MPMPSLAEQSEVMQRAQAWANTSVQPEYVSLPKAELERLWARITQLEAELAAMRGTLAEPQSEPPFHVEHDVPPSTPRE